VGLGFSRALVDLGNQAFDQTANLVANWANCIDTLTGWVIECPV
jgi:hypothetical protein